MQNIQATESGRLYIVGTPIGHMEDISLRAIVILKSVDLILAEDTRHSRVLLSFFGIKTKLVAFHAHNENNRTNEIIELLLMGKNIALISDAGTPLIADPGFPLVRMAHLQNIQTVPIPGACALIAALCASGLPCDSFRFVGFLPAKQSARKDRLKSFCREDTIICYESTHRLLECLEDMVTIFGQECELVLAKEITKTYERIIHGSLNEIKTWLLSAPEHIKGEFVLIIPPKYNLIQNDTHDDLLKILLEELPLKQAVKIACKLTLMNKNQLYERALTLKECLK